MSARFLIDHKGHEGTKEIFRSFSFVRFVSFAVGEFRTYLTGY